MKAMVLAAGFGTRLRPLTENRSKVTLSLAGVPVIVRVIRMLRAFGIEEIALNLHHAPESVRETVEKYGEKVVFIREPEILGTGGALRGARDFIDSTRTLLVNGDCYYGGPDLEAAIAFHESRGSIATMMLIGMPAGENYRGVEVAADGRLLSVAGRPEQQDRREGETLHFTGIHILEQEFIARIDEGFSDINSRHYVDAVSQGLPVFGFKTGFQWFDLGTPRRFLNAAGTIIREQTGNLSPEGIVIKGDNCRIAGSARITGPSELGEHCVISENCLVERSVLAGNVVVEAGCVIKDSLLGQGVRVEAGTSYQGVVAAVVNGRLVVEPID